MVGAPASASHPTPTTLARVAKEAAETGYELLGGQLRVVGAIGYDLNTGFRDKCDQLLASGEKELLVDLSQVLYLSSSHIGVIARLATDAMGQGKKVALRVTGKVARVLKFAGIDRLVELEDVDA
jgi:anti-anti-sigma factor